MTEYPRSGEPGGDGTMPPGVVARQRASGGAGMRSPRGFLGSVVLVLALPVAILIQALVGSGASLTMHVALTVGCVLLSLSAFEAPAWAAWIGRVAAGAFAAVFLLQAASELIRNDSLSYFAFEVLGSWPERVLVTVLVFWLVAVLLSTSRGSTRILGFVAMTVVVGVDIYNYVLLYLGESPAFTALYLLPSVWLLFESRKSEPKKVS